MRLLMKDPNGLGKAFAVQVALCAVSKQGEMMISTSCDLKQFIEAVQDKDYFDIIYFTDNEATEAERISYQKRKLASLNQKDYREYAQLLKGFILFMRHGIKAIGVSDRDLKLFSSISANPAQRRH